MLTAWPTFNGTVEADGGESVAFPMHEAAKRGNVPYLRELLDNKVGVNGLDKVRTVALHRWGNPAHPEHPFPSTQLISLLGNIGRLDTASLGIAWGTHRVCRGASQCGQHSD